MDACNSGSHPNFSPQISRRNRDSVRVARSIVISLPAAVSVIPTEYARKPNWCVMSDGATTPPSLAKHNDPSLSHCYGRSSIDVISLKYNRRVIYLHGVMNYCRLCSSVMQFVAFCEGKPPQAWRGMFLPSVDYQSMSCVIQRDFALKQGNEVSKLTKMNLSMALWPKKPWLEKCIALWSHCPPFVFAIHY